MNGQIFANDHRRHLSTLTNYYNPNDTYSPTFAAQFGSMLSPDSDLSLTEEYARSVGITVGAILIAGLVVWLIYIIFMFFRCCCRCVRCLPRRQRKKQHKSMAQRSGRDPNQTSRREMLSNPDAPETLTNTVADEQGGEVRPPAPVEPVVSSNKSSKKTSAKQEKYPWTCGRYLLYFLLFITSVIALATNQFFLVGRQAVTDGLHTGLSALDDVQSIFTSALNQTSVLVDYAGDLSDEYSQAETTCIALTLVSGFSSEAMDAVNSLETSMANIDSLISPINNKFDSFQSKSENYYSDGAAFFILWALVMISLGISWWFVLFEKRSELMTFLFSFVNFTYIVLILIQAVVMVFTVVMGDLCGNSASDTSIPGLSSSSNDDANNGPKTPTETILTLLPFSGDVLNTAQYYTTCVRNATTESVSVDGYLHEAYGYTAELTGAAQTGLYYCPNDPNLTQMLSTLGQMNHTLNTLGEVVSCPPIQQVWFKLVNDALCTDMYTGIFYIWGACLLTSAFLFGFMVLLTVIYQYWLPLDKMLPPKPLYRRKAPTSKRQQSGRNNHDEDDENFLRMYSGNIHDSDEEDGDSDEYFSEEEGGAVRSEDEHLAALNQAAQNYDDVRDRRHTERVASFHNI